jgi:hypothetical protein
MVIIKVVTKTVVKNSVCRRKLIHGLTSPSLITVIDSPQQVALLENLEMIIFAIPNSEDGATTQIYF